MLRINDRVIVKQYTDRLEVYGDKLFITTVCDLLKESDLAKTLKSINIVESKRSGYATGYVSVTEDTTSFDIFDFVYSVKAVWKTWIYDIKMIERLANRPVPFKEFVKMHEES